MKLSLVGTVLGALPMFLPGALAAATPKLEAREDCVVNALVTDSWDDGGWKRYQTSFSSENTDTEAYCDHWGSDKRGCLFWAVNVQCYYDDDVGSWVVDHSYAYGPAGESNAWCSTGQALDAWMDDTGCGTG